MKLWGCWRWVEFRETILVSFQGRGETSGKRRGLQATRAVELSLESITVYEAIPGFFLLRRNEEREMMRPFDP